MSFLNLFLFSFIFLFFFSCILGYGVIFNKYLFNDNEIKIGETVIFGFITLYLISVFFHFFLALNIFFSNLVLIFWFILFLINSDIIFK